MTRSGNRPPAAGISVAGRDRLHETMAGYVESGHLPGLVTLVARGDDVHVDTIGTAAFTDARPLARDAIFRIASLTKPIAAVAAMTLVEDGTLHLDAPIDELVPSSRTVGCCARSMPSSTTPCPRTARSRSSTCSPTGSASDR